MGFYVIRLNKGTSWHGQEFKLSWSTEYNAIAISDYIGWPKVHKWNDTSVEIKKKQAIKDILDWKQYKLLCKLH